MFRTLLLIILLLLPLQLPAMSLPVEVRQQLELQLTEGPQPPVVWLGGALELDGSLLPAFYRDRDFAPAWIGNTGLTGQALQLIEALRESSEDGLCSDEFRLPFIEPLVQLQHENLAHGVLFDSHYLAIFDLLLSDAFFRYAQALSGGRVPPARLPSLLQKRLARQELPRLLAELVPPQPGYSQLRDQLQGLRELSAYGGWPEIPVGAALRSGDKGERVRLLKKRLLLERDLEAPAAWLEEGFGELTEAGVRSFQERHGLTADGVAGPLTLAELNVPIEERIRQVELNLERWRHAPVDFGPRNIRVNVADYSLKVYEGDEVVMSMPVVVGTPYRKTPTFSAVMSYLEFAPYWYVPGTILREDKLPHIRSNPGWLSAHNYEIVPWGEGETGTQRINPLQVDWTQITSENFPGTLRMRPGPWNPLGQVKFIFPNRYAVYLHDTNERQLFSRSDRLYSSGCIRIERPLDLAQYLLEGVAGWDCDKIVAAMSGEETLKVDLPQKIPVHLLYWTAWVDDRQRLQYRPDIYLRDADLEESAGVMPQFIPGETGKVSRTGP